METLFPLAPFEQYMLEDDRAEYPMVFYIRLKFRGTLDKARFTAALSRAAGRHPLLQSVVRTIDGVASWAPAADPTPYLNWESNDKPINRAAAGPNDLTQNTGLRVWVREGRSDTSALLEFHHVCCDGIAAMQIVEDLLTAYSNEIAAAEGTRRATTPLRPLSPERLRDRARFGLSLAGRLLRAPLSIFAAVGLSEFFVHRPAPVAIPQPQRDDRDLKNDLKNGRNSGPASVSHRFTRLQVEELRNLAHRLGVTVNDLLVRDLLSTIDNWNQHHDPASAACVRVSVPVNLRLKSDSQLPATNVVSMVFVDRKPSRFRTPLGMLRSIRRDTWIIKRFRMGLAFNSVLSLLSRFRGALAGLLSTESCMASAVLSNLGPQLDTAPLPRRHGKIELGTATLDDIEFLPPIRPLTRMALGVVTYGGDLTVSLQYDASCLTPASAKSFLANYAAMIVSTSIGRRDEARQPVLVPTPALHWKFHSPRPQTAVAAVVAQSPT